MNPPLTLSLTPTAEAVAPGAPLPLRLALANHTDQPLAGAVAELTLEVERGVLLTWNLTLATVPPRGRVEDAVTGAAPTFELPLNVPGGTGRFRLALTGADGGWLGAAELELPVVGG